MLSGYSANHNDVIHQDNPNIIQYNVPYLLTRPQGNDNNTISFLRLGFIIGSIGEMPSSICDVGYGSGDFLIICEDFIKDRSGIEINGWKLPPGCKKGSYLLYYDVMTFFDVLEHFPTLDFIKSLQCKYLVISVPSCNYGEDDEWFSQWNHRKPNEHLWHFNSLSIAKQMQEYDFQHICTMNIEDVIRKSKNKPNIITAIFRKKI
jgi:hypothetical protein